MPRPSVVLPCDDSDRHSTKAIAPVHQPAAPDFEGLVRDDRSTGSSLESAQRCAAQARQGRGAAVYGGTAAAKTAAATLATLLLVGSGINQAVLAQSVSQSVQPARNTRVTRQGNRLDISGGRRSRDGRNLFHTFRQFGLSQGEIANFLSTREVRNILARVNGGSASLIDGILRVSGSNANLYLMNPAGVIFGRNARLDLAGSFTATTASGIGFANGWFSAVGDANYDALVGNPQNFAFAMAQPGAIVNAGDLAVAPGNHLTLLGGTVVNTGTASAPGGMVTLSSVPGQNRVRISQAGSLLSLEIQPSAFR
ncbi:filamentous hemagglutinin N-terminal domain-containing protein, partial [Thermoleptolyngbya sp. M55_K2018_002]|uniref:filamentous hemagglutinin N-terminal domain-containing protein n=1 Tax=Thermoleptolyngbya sp. M55_K2018_002 TaxID=2747808 RepID=UPI0019E0CAE0